MNGIDGPSTEATTSPSFTSQQDDSGKRLASNESSNSADMNSSDIARQPGPPDALHLEPALSVRTTLAGILVGVLICFTNTYFGLQAGFIAIMSLPATLIGFAGFKAIEGHLRTPLAPAENAVLVTIAGSLGTMPFTAGLIGVIPALEFLTTPAENGPFKLASWQLCIWCVGISILGVVIALPFRNYFIIRERLRFPFGTSTAALIGLLHKDTSIAENVQKANVISNESDTDAQQHVREEDECSRDSVQSMDHALWIRNNYRILVSFFCSPTYVSKGTFIFQRRH